MLNTINNQISTIYQNGNKMILLYPWEDSNIIVPNNKFYFVKEGEIEITAGDKTFIVSDNEWLLIPAGILHSYRLTSKKYAKLYWVHFELLLNDKSFFNNLTAPVKIKATQSNKIINLFNKIFKFSKINTLSAQLEVATSLNSLVSIYLNKLPAQVSLRDNDAIDDIINYITNNYSEKFSLTELATRADFSVSQFTFNFKKRTGVSPIYYINLTRLEHAKYLLEQTSYPIGVIMEKVGYLDSAYFSKIFKKYYNICPLQYRAIAQKNMNARVIK